MPLELDCPLVDATKTLAELTGFDWGPPQPDARMAVQERHEIRSKRLSDWTDHELIKFLCMGVDEQFLIPLALARLKTNPVASGCEREGEMLSAVLECDRFDWKANHRCVRCIREVATAALNEIGQDNDELRALTAGWHLYRSLSIFERRLSSIL
jgi:hypothetical protein